MWTSRSMAGLNSSSSRFSPFHRIKIAEDGGAGDSDRLGSLPALNSCWAIRRRTRNHFRAHSGCGCAQASASSYNLLLPSALRILAMTQSILIRSDCMVYLFLINGIRWLQGSIATDLWAPAVRRRITGRARIPGRLQRRRGGTVQASLLSIW